MSDQLASEFCIVIENPAKGLWSLRGESLVRIRKNSLVYYLDGVFSERITAPCFTAST